MNLVEARRQWASDAVLLATIGGQLFPQPTRITVRLPISLAEAALEAWQREDFVGHISGETPGQAVTRRRAGSLALIGQSIEELGVIDGNQMVVSLDAWQIGDAFHAADDTGLLHGREPTS